MVTKKAVKSADLELKEIQTEELQDMEETALRTEGTRDSNNDGEYNKYPLYHGCIRFDDDNIVCVTPDSVRLPATVTITDIIGGVTDLKYRFKNFTYIKSLNTNIGGSSGNPLINVPTFIERVQAFYLDVPTLGDYFLGVASNAKCDVDIYIKTASLGNIGNPLIVDQSTRSINVYYDGDITDDFKAKIGVPNAVYHGNYTLPDVSEFIERYKS